MRIFGIGLLVSSLVACAIPEEDFPEIFGKEACKRLEECDKGWYESNYEDDRAECIDDQADLADFLLDAGDLLGNEYDPAKGRDCVRNLRQASCGDIQDGDVDCDLWADD